MTDSSSRTGAMVVVGSTFTVVGLSVVVVVVDSLLRLLGRETTTVGVEIDT